VQKILKQSSGSVTIVKVLDDGVNIGDVPSDAAEETIHTLVTNNNEDDS